MTTPSSHLDLLARRERYRDDYWLHRDPIHADRLLWRAQVCRHLVHLVPGQTILELGAGRGYFTSALRSVTRGRNPIVAARFGEEANHRPGLPGVEVLDIADLPGPLAGRTFDLIVAMDLLDRSNSAWLARQAFDLLAPGGELILYESNPWNVVLRLRRALGRLIRRPDQRRLLDRRKLYELLSEVGFIRVFAVYNDFVYPPLSARLIWLVRNLSIVLENLPGIRSLAGSILIHAQKPPRPTVPRGGSLAARPELRNAVSVVVPCHNEAANVAPLVRGLIGYYGPYLHQIVLVDDNSTDHTAAEIRRLQAEEPRITAVFRQPPNGVGRAIADGYRAATGRYVLSMDADFQHLLPEFEDLFEAAAEGHDVVLGSRFSRHSVLLNYPVAKIIANRSFHVLAQLLLRRRFRDVTNNLKLMTKAVVDQLILEEPGFAVNAETGLQPILLGFRVKEVPISWINREPNMGSSTFRLARVGGGYWRVLRRLWRWPIPAKGPR